MSVYRSPRSPYWHFDFQVEVIAFYGTTKATTRREAEKVEAAEREKAKADVVAQLEAAKTSLRLDDVAGRSGRSGAASCRRRQYLSTSLHC